MFLFFIYFRNFGVFLHMLIFAIIAFWLILGVLIYTKFVKFLKGSTVRGGRYLLIYQAKICIIYAKIWMNISQYILLKVRVPLHSSQTQSILTVNYISLLCRLWKCKPFLFMKNWPSFFPGPLNVLLGKKKFL